jgi:L-lactate utilization protein LutC
MSERDDFLATVRSALGHGADVAPPRPPEATALSQDAPSVRRRAAAILADNEARGDELLLALARSAAEAGWTVARAGSPGEAAEYVAALARKLDATRLVRSDHEVFQQVDLDSSMAGTGVQLTLMAGREGDDDISALRSSLRERAIAAQIGVTGVDYAIAETGSCVLLAGRGVSRLVALLPPVHVAIVQRGQVLPSLDELFALRRDAFLDGDLGAYMNIITGPSRSADIEQTIVTGVHGPGDVHMVLLG